MREFNLELGNSWVTITNELGYSGNKKDQINKFYDVNFGEDQWSKAYLIDNKLSTKSEAIELYEDAYLHFLENNPSILEWLVNTASNVYDIDPSNVNSGLDYSIQECSATHLQDISVRRVLKRLGREFKGDHLIQIRGYNSEGYVLNPGQVPFHKPELILDSFTKNWWKSDSIEAFYQHNKALLVNPDKLIVTPEIEMPNGEIIYRNSRSSYYQQLNSNPLIIKRLKGKDVRRRTHYDKKMKVLRDQETKPYSKFVNLM